MLSISAKQKQHVRKNNNNKTTASGAGQTKIKSHIRTHIASNKNNNEVRADPLERCHDGPQTLPENKNNYQA